MLLEKTKPADAQRTPLRALHTFCGTKSFITSQIRDPAASANGSPTHTPHLAPVVFFVPFVVQKNHRTNRVSPCPSVSLRVLRGEKKHKPAPPHPRDPRAPAREPLSQSSLGSAGASPSQTRIENGKHFQQRPRAFPCIPCPPW